MVLSFIPKQHLSGFVLCAKHLVYPIPVSWFTYAINLWHDNHKCDWRRSQGPGAGTIPRSVSKPSAFRSIESWLHFAAALCAQIGLLRAPSDCSKCLSRTGFGWGTLNGRFLWRVAWLPPDPSSPDHPIEAELCSRTVTADAKFEPCMVVEIRINKRLGSSSSWTNASGPTT